MAYDHYTQAEAEHWLGLALSEARKAQQAGEIPVGALLLDSDGSVLSLSHNLCVNQKDPTAHAEVLALRKAARVKANYRLPGTLLVCTLEPCLMCLGAMTQARVSGLLFGTRDPRSGAVISRLSYPDDVPWLNHYFWWQEGYYRQECSNLLKDFFQDKRGTWK